MTKNIEEIHTQIDEIINAINNRIEKLGDRFKPWTNENRTPEYYIKQQNISIEDTVQFRTVQEV